MNAIICTSHKLIRTEIFYYFIKSIRSKKVGRKASGAKNKQQEEHFMLPVFGVTADWASADQSETSQDVQRDIYAEIVVVVFLSEYKMFSGLSWEIWGSGIWVKQRQRAVTCAADKQPLEHVSAQRQANEAADCCWHNNMLTSSPAETRPH